MPDYGKSRLRIFFSPCESLSPAIRCCLTRQASPAPGASRGAREKVLSRILGVPPCATTDTADGGRLVVVARGRIGGEWTTPCYQLAASRLPRADKLLYPHRRTILYVPNQADLSCASNTGLLVSLPCPISSSRHSQLPKVEVPRYITA